MKTLVLSSLLLLLMLCEGYTRIFRPTTSSSPSSTSFTALSLFSSSFSSQSLQSSSLSLNSNIDATQDTDSVHLQLTGKLDHRVNETNNTSINSENTDSNNNRTSNRYLVGLLEFYDNNDNKTIIARLLIILLPLPLSLSLSL